MTKKIETYKRNEFIKPTFIMIKIQFFIVIDNPALISVQ